MLLYMKGAIIMCVNTLLSYILYKNKPDFFHMWQLICELTSAKQACDVVWSLQEKPQGGQQVNLPIPPSQQTELQQFYISCSQSMPQNRLQGSGAPPCH